MENVVGQARKSTFSIVTVSLYSLCLDGEEINLVCVERVSFIKSHAELHLTTVSSLRYSLL